LCDHSRSPIDSVYDKHGVAWKPNYVVDGTVLAWPASRAANHARESTPRVVDPWADSLGEYPDITARTSTNAERHLVDFTFDDVGPQPRLDGTHDLAPRAAK